MESSLQNTFSDYREALLRLFYPHLCACCEKLLELKEKGLCGPCNTRLASLQLNLSEQRVRLSLPRFEGGWALYPYEGPMKEIIHKIKFERRRDLLSLFERDLAIFLEHHPDLDSYDRVVSIPQDLSRRLEREFNQAELIASTVRRLLNKKKKGALLHKQRTLVQSLLGREARKLNLENAFRIAGREKIKGESILLVVDVLTTGATLNEAARTLKEAGVLHIAFLVLARTSGHPASRFQSTN